MCRLIETLKIKNGKVYNIDFHSLRMNRTRRALFGCRDEIDLKKEIGKIPSKGLMKCRILYGGFIHEIQFVPYRIPEIRSLQLVRNDAIDYSFKYENRESLKALFEQRGTADDILIIKNRGVTDTCFCNVVFEQSGLFYTPSTCLLAGTKRQYLLEKKVVQERPIRESDILEYEKIYLVNAMIDLEDNLSIDIQQISF